MKTTKSLQRIGSRIEVLVGILLLAATINVASASTYEGYIQNIVQIGTTVFISIGGGFYGSVNCGTGTGGMWLYVDTTTAGGSTYVALALSSKLSGNEVYVSGNGVCFSGNTPNGGISEAMSVMYLL